MGRSYQLREDLVAAFGYSEHRLFIRVELTRLLLRSHRWLGTEFDTGKEESTGGLASNHPASS